MSDLNLDSDIAVVGMAGRFAGARNLTEFWSNLRDGVESLQRFTESELLAAGADPADLANPNYVPVGAVMPDMEGFDAKFFGFSPREASIMDPQHRHFLEVAWEALENAAHVPANFKGSIGVFGGSGHNAYLPYNLLTNPQLIRQMGFFLVRHTGNDKDFLTTRVSYLLNLKGPSVNVQTACSTSLVAIHLGVQSLLNRECDMALAGGVTIEMPHRQGYVYHESEILSPDGHCRAFDANSKGTVFGSGCGVVVLRRLQDAIDDGDHIHAIIKGSAVNNDGALKVGYMAPSVDGQAKAIAEALALADVSAETITYVEAHGTGTPVGDPIEIAALTQAFRESTDKVGYCGVGSVKPNVGHTDTAAGVASFLKVALALQHKQLPPSLFFENNNPACRFETSPFYVNKSLKDWTPPPGVPRRAGVSSLGVGGTNAHVVMQEAPVREASGPSRKHQLLVLSAKSNASLDGACRQLADHLARDTSSPLADVAHTLRVGREAMKLRRVVVAKDAQDAAHALRTQEASRVFSDTASEDPKRVAFMFAGGGAQHPNMGLDLYREEPVYRTAVDECLTICKSRLNKDLRGLMFPAAGEEAQAAKALEKPSLALPALLTVQVAMAKLMMSWGIEPASMIGHSMGEYTAAHLAGVFTLEEALTLVELRGRLFESLPEGAMLSVPMSETDVAAHLSSDLSISVVNSPTMTVVGGPLAAIDALQAKLAAMDIDAAKVRINVAAHSSMLEPILEPFGQFLKTLKLKPPTKPFVSNLSGALINPHEATDPQYWVKHLRHTVRFAAGLQALLADGSCVLLEVGPGRTLSSLARQHPARKPDQAVVNSMRHPDEAVDDQAHALAALGRLWACGVNVPWSKLQGDERRLRVPLPTYAFDHQRHWVEPGRGSRDLAPHERVLHKRKDLSQWFYEPRWMAKPLPTIAAMPEQASADDDRGSRALIFADAKGIGEGLAAAWRGRGDEVIVVREGTSYTRTDACSFTITPDAADMRRLIEELGSEGRVPSRIVHAWSIDAGDDLTAARAPSLQSVRQSRRLGFDSLLALMQAMGEEDWSLPTKLLVLSERGQAVAGETLLDPGKALLAGPVTVAPREFNHLRCAWLDVQTVGHAPSSHRRRQALLAALIGEMDGPLADSVVALRGSTRWVQTHAPMPLPPARVAEDSRAERLAPTLRDQGVYLITGGLGGVGLAMAEHLASKVCAKLILISRTSMPPRERWADVLVQADADPSVAQRVRKLMALERRGAQLLVASADVTQEASLVAVLEQAKQRFGAIDGVLHTAGVLDDGVIQLKEDSTVSRVLAPKVDGTLVLDAALQRVHAHKPPAFMVLYSSISAFAGLAGQIDYAAANAFLDAYAQFKQQHDGTYCVAVNWSQWQEVGMAAEMAHRLGLDEDVRAEHEPQPIGHPLAQVCLLNTAAERVTQARLSRETHWLLEEHRIAGGEALIPGTGYLEIVRTAFTQHAKPSASQAVELRDVVFLAPFVVRPGQSRDMRVHLRPREANAVAFTVTGKDVEGTSSWTEHARGTVALVELGEAQPKLALDAIRARCRVREQLGAATPSNLHFGPRWNNIVRVDHGVREALIELALGEAFGGDLETFPLHPALMDLATAGAQSLIEGYDDRRDFYVPASYERLVVHGPLTPQLRSHVRLHRDVEAGADLATYDVTVTDPQGHVLVDITGFTMIRVRDKSLMSRSAATAGQLPAQQPRATANKVLAMGMRDGILNTEGADALERVLSWGQGPRIVVSPVDLEALLAQLNGPPAAPTVAQDRAGNNDAASDRRMPRTATEVLIAAMWSEMLGHAKISAEDNFFDLGGHSLLAVQVINKLKKRTGKSLPLTALLEAPTVEELAALIEPPGTEGEGDAAVASATTTKPAKAFARTPGVKRPGVVNRTLIPIRQGEGRPPLFLVHDGIGETLLYRTLANKLKPGHAVYGLQPAMKADSTFTDTTISDMAKAHIEQMRSVQPEGPYYVAGLCAGGVIAAEMALQLQQAGQSTAYLGLLDAADVAAQESNYEQRQRMARLKATFDDGSGAPLPIRLLRALPRVASKAVGYARWRIQRQLETKRNQATVQAMRERDALPPDSAVSDAEQNGATTPMQLSFLKMYQVAHRAHRPAGQVDQGDRGHTVVYRAQKGTGAPDDVAFIEKYTDEALGWRPRFKQEIAVVDVPGGHTSLLQEPHVQTLAARMQSDIDRAMELQGASQSSTQPSGAPT